MKIIFVGAVWRRFCFWFFFHIIKQTSCQEGSVPLEKKILYFVRVFLFKKFFGPSLKISKIKFLNPQKFCLATSQHIVKNEKKKSRNFFNVNCNLLHVTCNFLHVTCNFFHVTCNFFACGMRCDNFLIFLLHATFYTQRVVCDMWHFTFDMCIIRYTISGRWTHPLKFSKSSGYVPELRESRQKFFWERVLKFFVWKILERGEKFLWRGYLPHNSPWKFWTNFFLAFVQFWFK